MQDLWVNIRILLALWSEKLKMLIFTHLLGGLACTRLREPVRRLNHVYLHGVLPANSSGCVGLRVLA